MSHVLVNAIFVVETLLSLSGMLLAVTASRCADPPAEELPLPLLRLCLSSEGEMGPGELSTCKNFYVSCYVHGPKLLLSYVFEFEFVVVMKCK